MVSLVLLYHLSFSSYASHRVYHAMECLSTSTALSNKDLCNVLVLGKLLHDHHWYSLMWFAWIHMLFLMWCMYVLPSVPWPSLTSIMNYPLCMTHDLATANHHDHAWTEKWAHNICKLSMPMSIVRLLSNPREHRQRGHFYRMYGTWKNYPPQHALLNVGFMTILRRTDCFILIWTCSTVLTEPRNCHFQIVPASK